MEEPEHLTTYIPKEDDSSSHQSLFRRFWGGVPASPAGNNRSISLNREPPPPVEAAKSGRIEVES